MDPSESLYDRISAGQELAEKERDALLRLFGHRCREKTKGKLATALRWVPDIPNYGIYKRVMLSPMIHYCPGQSYSDEIRVVRECLIGR